MAGVVPERPDTVGLLQLTRAVRAALEASDQGRLTVTRLKQVDAVLAAFVPDFAREGSRTPAARKELIQAVVEALPLSIYLSIYRDYRDEDTVQSLPTRRGAFAGWDAQGGELPYTLQEAAWRRAGRRRC